MYRAIESLRGTCWSLCEVNQDYRVTDKIAREFSDRLSYAHKCHQNYDPRNGGHFERQAAIGRRICHITAMSQCRAQ